jgi:Ca2+-binding EF-hand superfamily protein
LSGRFRYDEDSNGTLSRAELEKALHRTGVFTLQDIYGLFHEADITGDGQISLQEFRTCFEQHMTD